MEKAQRFRNIARSGHGVFRRRRWVEAASLAVSFLLPLALAAVALGMLFRFHPVSGWAPTAMAAVAVVAAAVVAVRYLTRNRLQYEEFLRHLEHRLSLRRNELVNADELESRLDAMEDPLSRGLAAQAVDSGIEQVRRVRFGELAPKRSVRGPWLRSLATVAVAVALFFVAPQSFQGALARIATPGTYELPPAIRIDVTPGNVVLQRGQVLSITASVPSDAEGAQLFWRSDGGAWRTLDMNAGAAAADGDERTEFAAALRGLVENSEYAVATKDARSQTYEVQVTEPLRAVGYRKSVTPPAYTGLPKSQELSANGNVSAIFGSELRLGIQTGRPGTDGSLIWEDGTSQPLTEADDGLLIAELRMDETRSYTVELTAEELEDVKWNSRVFKLEPVADRMPTLYQLAPEVSVDLPPEMIVQLDADCVDDFGLSRLDLVYQRNDQPKVRERLATWKGDREARVVHDWDLEGIALVPGDVIQYHLELTDNDVISGPKTVRGPASEIRFPSLEELYAEVEKDRDEQMGDVGDLRAEQEEIRDELDKALSDLRKQKDMDWEQQEALKDLAERQENVTKKLEELSKSLDQSLEEMQQAELFSPELLAKVEEINKLSKEIQNPEFQQQMDQLKDALEELDKNKVENTLEQMKMSQQDLSQSLERTLELLKRMKNEEELDELVQKSQRLLEEQERLNDEMARKMGDEPQDRDEPQDDPQNDADGENSDDAEDSEGEDTEGENSEGENAEGEDSEGEDSEGENAEGDDSESQEGDDSESSESDSESESSESDSQEGESSEGNQEQNSSEQNPSDQNSGDPQQQDQAQSSESPMSPEERAEMEKKQEELEKQLEELKEQLAELQKEAEENWEELSEELSESQPQKKLDEAQQNMEQSQQNMSGSPQQSMKFGRQAEQDLQEFAQQMQQAQENVAQEEQEDITRDLFRISGQLVHVSEGQEGLLGRAPSQPTRDLAAEQAQLSKSARQSLNDLYELGKKSRILSPDLTREMSGAVNALEHSTKAFEKGNRQSAMAQGTKSTNTLNSTVIELLEANEQMCNNPSSGSCNNPMSKMRSLSAQQQQLNSDSKNMMGQQQRLQQQGGSKQQLEEMAARQEMIRRGLAELEQSLGGRKDILGRLDELAEDMGDVVDEMKKENKIDDRILERQEKILSRLLTAQKSIRREDQKEERTARTGVNPEDRDSPPPVAQELGQKELLRRGILRGSQDPIPDEFRSLVEDYYESLADKP